MDFKEAMQVVYDLALQNQLDREENPDMAIECIKQEVALVMVDEFVRVLNSSTELEFFGEVVRVGITPN